MKANYTSGVKASPAGDVPRVMVAALLARFRFLRLVGVPLSAAIACYACSPATTPDSAIARADIEVIANPGHLGGVSRAAFFPGGGRLITTGWNGELRVWDTSNGSLIGLYRGHEHRVNAIAVSPSGTQFVTGDTAGNLMLWSFGDLNPRKQWTHSDTVRNVAFTGENDVLILSHQSLVSHDLLRNESRPVTLPSDTPPPEVMTFVGSRYLVQVHEENGTRQGIVRDLETLSPIADLHEDVADAIAKGHEPWPWGPLGIVIPSTWSPYDGIELLGADLLSGDFLQANFCNANNCRRATLDILAVDEASRRIAYATDSGKILAHTLGQERIDQDSYDKIADTLRLATIPPLRQVIANAAEEHRETGDMGTEVFLSYGNHWGGMPEGLPRLLSDAGGIQDIRRELLYGMSLQYYLGLMVPPRNRTAQSGGVRIELPEDLTGGMNLGEPTSSPHPFTLEQDYEYGKLNVEEGESVVQRMGPHYAYDVCAGSGDYCGGSPATAFGAMSANGRWVAGSTDNGFFATSLWLYHDVRSIEAAQLALRERGHLNGDVSGIDVESGYLVIADVDELFAKGTVALDGWFVDGEWTGAESGDDVVDPYSISGTVSRVTRDEDGQWWEGLRDSRPVSVRKTRLGRTVEALLRFQGDRGLAATGVLDERTRNALGVSRTLAAPRRGDGRWLWYQLPQELRNWHFDQGIAFTPDDSRIAIPGGTSVYVLDVRSGEFDKVASGVGDVVAVEFASNDELLVVHPFGVVAVDVATGRTQISPIGELASIDDIRVYDDGNAIRLEGRELVVLARRSERGESFEELVRVRKSSDTDWVAVTPAGFFAGSEDLSRRMYLRMGSRVHSLDQFYRSLYRPDLVRERLAGDPNGMYRSAASRMNADVLATEGPPPSVKIRWPQTGYVADDASQRVAVDLDDEGGGIGKVEWRVNGAILGVDANERGLGAVRPQFERLVPLAPGANRIEVQAYNAAGGIGSMPAIIDVEFVGPARQPRLFVLAAGVEEYTDRSLRLRFAVDDAQALAQVLEGRAETLFDGVFAKELLDADVTRGELSATFEALANRVRAEDVFIFFLAGHGVTVDGRYYFLPVDFRYHNQESFRESAVSEEDLQQWLSGIAAQKSLVMLDTCNSGSYVEAQLSSRGIAAKTAIDRLIRATGRATISASSASEVALEGVEGHGVLTYSLLEGLANSDRLNGNRDGWVSTLELTAFVADAVPELTMRHFGYEQVPQFNLHGTDFPLAKAR